MLHVPVPVLSVPAQSCCEGGPRARGLSHGPWLGSDSRPGPASDPLLFVLFKKVFKFSASLAVTENCQLCYCVAHSATGWVKPAFYAAVGGVWPGCGGDQGSTGERTPRPAGRAGREVLRSPLTPALSCLTGSP